MVRLLALAMIVALPACKDKKQDEDADPVVTEVPPPKPVAPARVKPFEGEKLGDLPGYIDGGLLYAAVRVGRVQSFLQALPLPPDAASDLAEAGGVFGLDFRVDDVRARFGLEPDAIISMTIARPLAADAEALRADLARGGPFLDALAMPDDPAPPPPPKVEIGYRGDSPPAVARAAPPSDDKAPEAVRVEPAKPHKVPSTEAVPGEPLREPEIIEPIPEDPPPPPRPSLEAIAAAEKFLRKAATLGIHSRINIPATDPNILVGEVKRIANRREVERWDPVCRAIPGANLCFGPNDMVVIFRAGKSAVDVDVVYFGGGGKPDATGRIATAREAALVFPSEQKHLAKLRGDAAAYLDASAIESLATVGELSQAIRWMEWTPPEDRRSTIDRRLEGIDAVGKLGAAPLLYKGVALEVAANGGDVTARMRWDPVEDKRSLAKSLMVGPEKGAEVPTIEALCEGAVACARARGLPVPSTWRDKLATGAFAEPKRDLERTLGRGDEWAALLVFAGAWPNLVGAVTRWPAQEIGRGPEAAIADNVVEAVGKLQGFGASVRSISVTGFRVQSDYAVYARAKRTELDLVRTLLAFAELNPAETAISGVDAKAEMVRLPVDEIPASLVLVHDSDETGFAALVDGPDRTAWLLGLPRDMGASPSAYFEIPDLWRLFSAQRDLERDVGFARSFLAGRQLRVALHVEDGAVEFRASSTQKKK